MQVSQILLSILQEGKSVYRKIWSLSQKQNILYQLQIFLPYQVMSKGQMTRKIVKWEDERDKLLINAFKSDNKVTWNHFFLSEVVLEKDYQGYIIDFVSRIF